jgi:hypothetical protein
MVKRMIKGLLVGTPQDFRGLEDKLPKTEVGEFDVTNISTLGIFMPELFNNEDSVYKKIKKQGEKLGANLAVISSNSVGITSYNSRGIFYKFK